MNYGTRMARDGHKLHVAWVGPLPIVSVDHPETFKQLVAQTPEKALGQTDGYRFLMPWIGELQWCDTRTIQICTFLKLCVLLTYSSYLTKYNYFYPLSIIQQAQLFTEYMHIV